MEVNNEKPADENAISDAKKSKEVKTVDEKNDCKSSEKDDTKSRSNKDDSKHSKSRRTRSRSKSTSKRRSRSRDKKDRKRSSTPDYKKRRSRSRDRRRSRDRKRSRSRDRKHRSRSTNRKRYRSRSKDKKVSDGTISTDKSYNDDKSPRKSYRHSDYDRSDRKRRKSRSRERDRRPYDNGERRYHGSPNRSHETNYDKSNYYDNDRKTDFSNNQRNNFYDRNYNRRYKDNQYGSDDNNDNCNNYNAKDTEEPIFGIDFSEQDKNSKNNTDDVADNKNLAIPVLLSSSSGNLSQNINNLREGSVEQKQPPNFIRPLMMPSGDLRFPPPPRLPTSQQNLLNFKETLPNMREPPPNFMAFRMDNNFQLRMNNNPNPPTQAASQSSQMLRLPLSVLNPGQIALRNFDPNQILRPMQMLQGPGARVELPIDLRLLNPELRLSLFNPNNPNRPPQLQPNQLNNMIRSFQIDPTRMMQQSLQPQQPPPSQHLLPSSQQLLQQSQQLLQQSQLPPLRIPSEQNVQQQQQTLSDIPPPPPPQSSLMNANIRPLLLQPQPLQQHQPHQHLQFNNSFNNLSDKNHNDSNVSNVLVRPNNSQSISMNQVPRPNFSIQANESLTQNRPVFLQQFPPPPPPQSLISQPTSTTNILDSLISNKQKSITLDEEKHDTTKINVKQKTTTSSELYSPNSCTSDNSSVDAYTEALFEEPFVDNGTPLEEESDTSFNISQSCNVLNTDIKNLETSNADKGKSNDDKATGNGIITFKDDNINKIITFKDDNINKIITFKDDNISNTINNNININNNNNGSTNSNSESNDTNALANLVQKNIDLSGTLNLFHVNDLKKVLETANSVSSKSKNDEFETRVCAEDGKESNPANSGLLTTKLSKAQKMDQIAEEVKAALKPHFFKKLINKDDYKDIMRRAVPKIFNSKSTLDSTRIQSFIQEYVNKITRNRKSGKMKNTTAHGASHDKKHLATKLNPKS